MFCSFLKDRQSPQVFQDHLRNQDVIWPASGLFWVSDLLPLRNVTGMEVIGHLLIRDGRWWYGVSYNSCQIFFHKPQNPQTKKVTTKRHSLSVRDETEQPVCALSASWRVSVGHLNGGNKSLVRTAGQDHMLSVVRVTEETAAKGTKNNRNMLCFSLISPILVLILA